MATLVSNGLTSESRVKDKLGLSGSTLDTIIKRMIYGVSEFIHKQCSTPSFKRATITDEIYNGSFPNTEKTNNILILKRNGVTAVSAVKYNAGTQASPSWVTMSASDYTVDYETGMIHFAGVMPRGIGNISVSYTAGYLIDFANEFDSELHTLPYELSELAERLVTKALKRRESEGRSNETFNGSTITWGAMLEDADKTILANYRRGFIA